MQFMNGLSFYSLIGLAAFAASVFIWFILRRKLQRLWLPVLRIVRRMPRRMPKLRIIKPPLVPFLCFIAAASMLVFYALAPAREILKPLSHQEHRFHVFIDTTPSMSARIGIDSLRKQVSALWDELSTSGQVTFSTSSSPEVVRPLSAEDFGKFISGLEFQRAGGRLGSVFKYQVGDIGKISRLYIVSDADFFSWGDFNWRFLAGDHDVVYVPMDSSKNDLNFFYGQVKYVDDPLSTRMTWEVEVIASGAHADSGGIITASFGDKTLVTKQWEIPASSRQTRILVDWPETDVAANAFGDAPILFKLEPATSDAMLIDNEFRVTVRGAKRSALVIAEPSGELALEDPVYHLQNSLQVMGYELERLDYVKQPGPSPDEHALIILAGGSGKGVDYFCPNSLVETRANNRSAGVPLPMVWLVPRTFNVDYGELCECFDRLIGAAGKNRSRYCQDVNNRDAWINVLASLGAKQVGGGLGEETAAIAWQKLDPEAGLDVMAFTLPLTPSRPSGISYASMPLILKELLTWRGQLSGAEDKSDGWPRINDMVTAIEETQNTNTDLMKERLLLSNVPMGESLMARVDAVNLPPDVARDATSLDESVAAARAKLDPLPFIRMMVLVVLVAMLAEIIWSAMMLLRRRRAAVWWLVFVPIMSLHAPQALAEVKLAMLGYGLGPQATASDLSREVSQRTSIDLSGEPLIVEKETLSKLTEPWLWIRSPDVLNGLNQKQRNDFLMWLKSGGFAVIEDTSNMASLDAFTSKAFANEPYKVQWQNIPLDHELMRSFHLLDTLPACGDKLWRGLHFDGRLVAVAIPYRFLESMLDKRRPPGCDLGVDQERLVRVYVNLLMVVLATDYKKDQIHLPEILKRLR